jgi:hypothetical protein
VREETGLTVEPDALTGVYKNLTRGVVALVFRCHETGGVLASTAEGTEPSRFSCRLLVGGVTGWWAGGLSVVGLLVLLGGEVVQAAVESPVVVPVDVVGGDGSRRRRVS